jgi:hypothetical protein
MNVSGCEVTNEEAREIGQIAERATTRRKKQPMAALTRDEKVVSVGWLQQGQQSDWRDRPKRIGQIA